MSGGLSLYALPVAYALFVWWFSTGIIIFLDNLPRRTHRWSFSAATILLAGCFLGLRATSTQMTVAGAYAGFTYGLLIWGWQEMSFFMGFVTGPVRENCPPGAGFGERFSRALWACLYHEMACLVGGAAMVALTWHAPNQVGVESYAVLWSMRLSAKLNVLLGVRNLSEAFIPEHLSFIRSFLRQKPMNLLFPVSVTVGTVVAERLVEQIGALGTDPAAATGLCFVALLLILAVIEHWFLVLPLPAAALWNWSLPKSGQTQQDGTLVEAPRSRYRWRSAAQRAIKPVLSESAPAAGLAGE